jgi:glyoxylase-like metal-dependent hydrolase (beta-lactamase superfamily II)
MSFWASQTNFPHKLTDQLWVLGNYFFNLYLVTGSHSSALIEAGVSAVVDTVVAQLDALEIAPDYLVLTHPHSDHFTGLDGLRERYPKARVVAGRGAREFVLHPKASAMIASEDRFISKQLAVRGLTPGRPPASTVSFPEQCLVVEDRAQIDLGGVTLQCFMVGGHAPGNILVHIPKLEALILSDSLGFHYPQRGFCPLFFTGLQDYLQTLKQIAALRPRIVGPAHQGALSGRSARQAIEAATGAARDMFDRVVSETRDHEILVAELFDQYYKDEFTLYSRKNIHNCMRLLVRRAMEAQ